MSAEKLPEELSEIAEIALVDLERLTIARQRTFIQSCIKTYKPGFFQSDESRRLIEILNDDEATDHSKWDALISYCKLKTNRHRTLYKIIQNNVYASKIELLIEIGDHYSKNKNYLEALKNYKKTEELCSDKNTYNHRHYFQKITQKVCDTQYELSKANLGTNEGTRFFQGRRKDSFYHSAAFFGQSIPKNIASVWPIIEGFDIIGLVLAIPLIPAATLLGVAQGIFRAKSRSPLDIDSQNNLFNVFLPEFLHRSNDEKQRLIVEIVRTYRNTQSLATSDSSGELKKVLEDGSKTLEEKTKKIVEYMSCENKGMLKNNGKKLFLIINDKLKESLEHHLNTDEKHRVGPTRHVNL